jgi:hypothetical protein
VSVWVCWVDGVIQMARLLFDEDNESGDSWPYRVFRWTSVSANRCALPEPYCPRFCVSRLSKSNDLCRELVQPESHGKRGGCVGRRRPAMLQKTSLERSGCAVVKKRSQMRGPPISFARLYLFVPMGVIVMGHRSQKTQSNLRAEGRRRWTQNFCHAYSLPF